MVAGGDGAAGTRGNIDCIIGCVCESEGENSMATSEAAIVEDEGAAHPLPMKPLVLCLLELGVW